MQYIMDNVNLCIKKCISTTKGTKTEYTARHPTDKAMKPNFQKWCKWFDETDLFTVSEQFTKGHESQVSGK